MNNKNFKIRFNLDFTSSKLLGYLILVTTSILGYCLSNPEIVVIGVISSSALSGVKSLSESWVKLKSGPLTNNDHVEESKTTDEEKS